jgi:hypothetical protein
MALVEAIIEVGGRRKGMKRTKSLHLARVREGMPASTDVGRERDEETSVVWWEHN